MREGVNGTAEGGTDDLLTARIGCPTERERVWQDAVERPQGCEDLPAAGRLRPALQEFDGLFCGVVPAHAVDAGAWWRGGGADIDFARRRCVMAARGAEEELAEIYGAAADVAADQVRVHVLEGAWGKDAAGENAIAKAGGETFDLRFERVEHIDSGAVGDVTVGPCDVLPCRSARGIEEAWLREEHEGPLRMATVAHVVFGRDDFVEAAAEMHGGGARAVR